MASTVFKNQHALALLSGLERMWSDESICDFSIIVGTQVFAVHRAVMAACSRYFKAMLSHNMKEQREGTVEIKDITPLAMQLCIEFLYSGEIKLKLENIADVLHAASFLQLDLLVLVCYDFLKQSLNVDTALFVKEVASLYSNQELISNCERFIVKNFTEIAETEDFLVLSEEEIRKYVENHDINVEHIWKGLVAWVEHDADRGEKLVSQLIALCQRPLNVRIIILSFWQESIVQKSRRCREILCNTLLRNLQLVKENIDLDTWYPLKKIAKNFTSSSGSLLGDEVSCYMADHFEAVARTEGWKSLTKEDVCDVLQAKSVVCSSERVKWDAALAWAKHERCRKRQFHDLLKLLDFSLLSGQFIRETVRNEPLIRESNACMGLVMDALADRTRVSEQPQRVEQANQLPRDCLPELPLVASLAEVLDAVLNPDLQDRQGNNNEDEDRTYACAGDVPRTENEGDWQDFWPPPDHPRCRRRGRPPHHHFHPPPPHHLHPPPPFHHHGPPFHHPPPHHHPRRRPPHHHPHHRPPHPHHGGRGRRGWRLHHHHANVEPDSTIPRRWENIMNRAAHDGDNGAEEEGFLPFH